ncbi:hypothetical protein [Paenibacillus piri]|uniref:hypothetical protein n=1 Tax=Paenibacillus piri TaxID=2547395 RepID=UPI001C7072D6|nr:hypothetical protein [Paenibacillus piri]
MRKLGRRRLHFHDKGHLWLIGGWSARVAPSCLHTICRHKGVSKVVLDRVNSIQLNIARPAVGASKLQRKGWTGKGVTIAVLDTGVLNEAAQPDQGVQGFDRPQKEAV